MGDQATGVRIKIKRAKEHIRQFEAERNAFLESDPYTTFSDNDVETGDTIVRVHVARQPDIYLGAIVGDAIHNLRAALDILWHTLMHPNARARDDRVGGKGFQIFDSSDDFERTYSRKYKGRRKFIVDIYKETKPYKGGNDPLYELNLVDIADKHHVLIPTGLGLAHTYVDPVSKHLLALGFPAVLGIGISSAGEKPIYPLYEGAVLQRIGSDQMDMYFSHAFDIAFGEPKIVEGQPILESLVKYADTVDGVLNSFLPLLG